MAKDWPLQSYLELGALPSAVPCARSHVRQVLREWGLAALTQTVELLVSEIVTNAVRASGGLEAARGLPTIRLWLVAGGQRVMVEVWDESHEKPERQEAGLDAESGRGLLLVETLSAAWGSYVPNGWAGKAVWARVEAT